MMRLSSVASVAAGEEDLPRRLDPGVVAHRDASGDGLDTVEKLSEPAGGVLLAWSYEPVGGW
jgi:hypothetical protein